MQNKTATFTVKDPNGQSHQIDGTPQELTLRDALSKVSGRLGGERWDDRKVRVAGREYGESDLNRSFADLGIQPGAVIEVASTA